MGQLYPQQQQVNAALQYNGLSSHSTFGTFLSNAIGTYWQDQIGVGGNWEIDFWGKFRRGVESADASLLASVADYDNAIVSLTADVATNYITIRMFEKRIEIALKNVDTQVQNLKVVEARREFGTATDREVAQATTQLKETQATVPSFQIQTPAGETRPEYPFGGSPLKPDAGAVRLVGHTGPPCAGHRRHPGRPHKEAARHTRRRVPRDGAVRSNRRRPLVSLSRLRPLRDFGFLSTNIGRSSLGETFQWGSRNWVVGPGITWNVLNYGQLTNNVRLQDARFQELLTTYQNTVLTAQQNVEDAIVAYLRSQERAELLASSTSAAQRSLERGQPPVYIWDDRFHDGNRQLAVALDRAG